MDTTDEGPEILATVDIWIPQDCGTFSKKLMRRICRSLCSCEPQISFKEGGTLVRGVCVFVSGESREENAS
jgi:hypothetical protein